MLKSYCPIGQELLSPHTAHVFLASFQGGMLMKKRLVSISLIVLLVISLASCSSEKDIHDLKTRFESFSADSNVIVVLDDSVFYFADHTLSLSDITDDEELNNGYLFWDGKLFFTTVKQNGGFDFSLCVYSCD